MNDCKICFHKGEGRIMQRPVSGECERCNPRPIENLANDACVCPPLGEPRFLPIIAPVVFDECGINLCREICLPNELIEEYPTTDAIELKVIDIDFNLKCDEGSKVDFITRRPNCVRVKLARLCVKFAAKLLDANCRVLAVECFSAEYLPESCAPSFDEELNPSSVTVELYAPYGLSYLDDCGKCKPTINFLGFVEGHGGNNELRQGIGSQALAKVVDIDFDSGCIAVGLTIYLKSVYFVQYKLQHAGLCV